MHFQMISELHKRVEQLFDESRRSPGNLPPTEGSVDSRRSSTSATHVANDPPGFSVFMKVVTRQYANMLVIRDPAALSLVVERRFNIFDDFIAFVDIPSNDADMIKHVKGLDKDKVRSMTTPRTTHYAKNTNAPSPRADFSGPHCCQSGRSR
jgi:hypothetical protein